MFDPLWFVNSLSLKERRFSYAGNNDYYNLCRDHF